MNTPDSKDVDVEATLNDLYVSEINASISWIGGGGTQLSEVRHERGLGHARIHSFIAGGKLGANAVRFSRHRGAALALPLGGGVLSRDSDDRPYDDHPGRRGRMIELGWLIGCRITNQLFNSNKCFALFRP
jgi:hypothetical protein